MVTSANGYFVTPVAGKALSELVEDKAKAYPLFSTFHTLLVHATRDTSNDLQGERADDMVQRRHHPVQEMLLKEGVTYGKHCRCGRLGTFLAASDGNADNSVVWGLRFPAANGMIGLTADGETQHGIPGTPHDDEQRSLHACETAPLAINLPTLASPLPARPASMRMDTHTRLTAVLCATSPCEREAVVGHVQAILSALSAARADASKPPLDEDKAFFVFQSLHDSPDSPIAAASEQPTAVLTLGLSPLQLRTQTRRQLAPLLEGGEWEWERAPSRNVPQILSASGVRLVDESHVAARARAVLEAGMLAAKSAPATWGSSPNPPRHARNQSVALTKSAKRRQRSRGSTKSNKPSK